MKCLTTVRTGLTVLSLIVLFPTLAVADAAGHALPPPTHPRPAATASLTPQPTPPPAERCEKLDIISPLLWYATDVAGEVNTDEIVDRYPSGAIALAYGFFYKCVPPRTLLSELVYALDYSDAPLYSEDVLLPADPKRGGYHWRLTLEDDEPFSDGAYRVEFYDGEELLVGGEITVGEGGADNGDNVIGEKTIVAQVGRSSAEATAQPEEAEEPEETGQPEELATPTRRPTRRPTRTPTEEPEPEPTATHEPTKPPTPRHMPTTDNKVQINGTIIDGTTGHPIGGAVFIVLKPGITAAQWANYGYPPSDILSSQKTDVNGQFRHPGLEIGVEYSIIVWALSYSAWWDDEFRLTEDDPDPYPLTITLYR
ncbi:MAG: carboxypeptidase-like regulatory domain-containing protein [Anaerolineae bacterium]